ncbi:MAG: S9 family peptidase [Longimicrobiales bacterium]
MRPCRSPALVPLAAALAAATLVLLAAPPAAAQSIAATGPSEIFQPMDVFGLELGSDPRISPDGETVVFARTWFDAMTDGRRSNLWILPYEGGEMRPLTTGSQNDYSPRWSPSGDRLAYVSTADGGSELWMRWMDTGQTAKLTALTESPGSLVWSPDGRWLAFTMFVPESGPGLSVDMPRPPEGADWGPAWKYIDEMDYRADGAGYLRGGHRHIFVVPAEGGTPRQLTDGPFDHGSPAWTADGSAILFSADRRERAENELANTEIYRVEVETGEVTQLTDREGPAGSPVVSPDGRRIAWTGRGEEFLGYQQSRLHVMNADGSDVRVLTADLDRSVSSPTWSDDGRRIYVSSTWHGNGRILAIDARDGGVTEIVDRVGGMSFGRPYGGGSYSVAGNGRVAFTQSDPYRPAEVAVADARRPGEARQLTALNAELLGPKTLGEVEEVWYESSYDGRRIHGWIIKPPNFDPDERYPLVLEIHGGPFSDYGPRFAAELQLYAAAGYVVLYTNPRGSTSYGMEFGNLIHHAYPGQDYDDLMSGVDEVLERGYVDPDQLYVTGGSGGGVLSAWIVGKTDRFRAAVVQKPVINWYSFVLYADGPNTFYRYWFPSAPWEDPEHYMERSPISLVGNVTTPTMLVTGERDHRTPIPESEQYYAALKIRGIPTALVRVPDAGHGIASKPSNLIAKTAYVLGWFEKWRDR